MKIETIAKNWTRSYHQFSNIILDNYLLFFREISFLFVSSRKIEKFFKIVCCSSEHFFFLRNDFDSAFYQGWFGYYTHTSTMCTRIYTGGTAFSVRKTPAIAMPETSCASAVFYPFHLFSLFLLRSLPPLSLSFFFYLYPSPRTFENRYSEIIFRRFFEQ